MHRVKDTIKSYHSKSSSTFFGLSKREFKETSLKEQAQYALVNSDANLSLKALSSLVLEGVRLNAKGISLGAKTLEIKPLVLESIETKEWSKGTLLSPSFYQESLERLSLAPSFIESKDLSINALNTTIKASNIKARDVSINTQALDLMSLKNRETKSSFSSNASSFLLAKNTKEGSIKEVAIPSTLSFSNSFVFNGRDLSKEVQELSKGLNNESQESLTLSSEMPLALDSSMVFSKAFLENKQWSERSKSLTPLSHLLLQAALAYISAGINLPIHSTFVSSVAKGSMQGALGSGVFQVSNKLIDSKNALSFRSFTKDTLGGGLKAGIGLLPLNLSLVEGIETLPLREIVLNASVDTLIYNQGLKESLLEYSLLALGNSLYKGVGDIAQIQSMKGNNLFKEGGLGKVVLHSGVGGVMASLKNENFFKGALISGIHESIAPLRGNPIENKEREVLISKVYGGVVGGLLGGNSLMALGSALSESAERYNRELHYDDYVVATDGIEDNKVVQLTKEEYEWLMSNKGALGEYEMGIGEYGVIQAGAPHYVPKSFYDNRLIIYKNPITKEFTNKDLNLNNPRDFETLRRRTDMSYENINKGTDIIYVNGMRNTLEDARNSANLIQRDFLNKQVGIVNNATGGIVNDVLEYSSPLSVKDSLNAYMLRQMTKDSVVITHSAGNEDIYKANYLNALMKLKTDYKLISIGSPKSKKDLRESTNAVGAELVRQVNDSRDPVANQLGAALDIVGNAIVGASRGGAIGGIIGIGGGIGITFHKLDEYHSFESYYNNPEFQLQQTIQRLLMQDAMKKVNEKELSNDKD